MKTPEEKLEELQNTDWTFGGDKNCDGCDGTLQIWVNPKGGQAEYCPDCGLHFTA